MPWSLVIESPMRLWWRPWSVSEEAQTNMRSLMNAWDEINELRALLNQVPLTTSQDLPR